EDRDLELAKDVGDPADQLGPPRLMAVRQEHISHADPPGFLTRPNYADGRVRRNGVRSKTGSDGDRKREDASPQAAASFACTAGMSSTPSHSRPSARMGW